MRRRGMQPGAAAMRLGHGWGGEMCNDDDQVGGFETQISCASCTTIYRAAKTLTALFSRAAKLLTALSSFLGNQLVHSEFKGPIVLLVYYVIMLL